MKKIVFTLIYVYVSISLFSASYVVTNSNDNGEGSFRYLVSIAGEGDTIYFACGLTEVQLKTGQITIDKSLRIVGCHSVLRRTADNLFRILEISGDKEISVSFTEVEFANGKTLSVDSLGVVSGEPGAGVYISNPKAKVILNDCSVFENQTGYGKQTGNAGNGAGIYINKAHLELLNCNIYNNKTGDGNLFKKKSNGGNGGDGAGIYINEGFLVITNSSIYENETGFGVSNNSGLKGIGYGGRGSGIFAFNSQVQIINSTISDNITGGSELDYAGFGAGMYLSGENSIIELINCTITRNKTGVSGNQEAAVGAGIFIDALVSFSLKNSIAEGNIIGIENGSTTAYDIFGEVINAYNNIVGKIDGCIGIENEINGNITGTIENPVTAGVLPLTDNGGFTKTCPISENSIAINSGNNQFALNVDQRNYERVGEPDIGSFEFGQSPYIIDVFSETPDGNYFTDDIITIKVVFSEPVWVVGDFFIHLETGNTVRYANYYGGTGKDTITFKYLIENGDLSEDLDVKSQVSLLPGLNCIMYDYDNYRAVLVLPEPGEEKSLSFNSDIAVNIVADVNKIENNNLKVYPNPAQEIIYCKTQNNEHSEMEVFDIQGKIVFRSSFVKENEFNISHLKKGVYVVKVINEENIYIEKLIVR